MHKITFRKKSYRDYGKCLELSNGAVDLVTTIEIGPRIIRYGFVGSQNEFCDNSPIIKNTKNGDWRLIGGHRLWYSPEYFPRTYIPDDSPVEWGKIENGLRVINNPHGWVKIKKVMDIILSPVDTRVKVIHKLTNYNAWSIEIAVWPVTAMVLGGIEIIPRLYKKDFALDFSEKDLEIITIWPFSKMNDPRVNWGKKYIILRLDRSIQDRIKFGISNREGWAAYLNNNHLFIKKYSHNNNARYPDGGVSYETYACDHMLEMESLSPLTILEPGEEITHTEEWELFDGVDIKADEEEHVDEVKKRYINK
jgi:hypothetical protein